MVDDHHVVRRGVAGVIGDARPTWEVCGEASTGREAVAAAASLRPDIVVMDISMPDMNGLEATREILKNNPGTEILILSVHESEQMVHDVLSAGARGYMLKQDAGTELIAALEALRQHKLYFTPRVSELVLGGYLGHAPAEAPGDARPEWEVCGEASTGREAVAAAARLKPDIVVMDISMPDMNGLEATREILKDNPGTEILILSVHESEQMVHDVLSAGARGYILKHDAGTDLIAALEALRQHRLCFTPRVSELVLGGYLGRAAAEAPADAPFSRLSPREIQIVQLVAESKSNKEVADILDISVKTVEAHRAHIMEKLGLHSVAELVRYAVRNNIVDSEGI